MISRAWLPERVANAMWRSFRIRPCALNQPTLATHEVTPGARLPDARSLPCSQRAERQDSLTPVPSHCCKEWRPRRTALEHGLLSLLQNFQPYTGAVPGSHGIPGTPVWLGNFQRILDTSHEVELFPNYAVSLEQFSKTSKKKRKGKTKDLGGRF